RFVLVVVRNTWGEAMGLAMEGRSEFGMDDPRRRAGTLAQARAIALLERKQAEAARRTRRSRTLGPYDDTAPRRTVPPAARRARTSAPTGRPRTAPPEASAVRPRRPRVTTPGESRARATL